MKNLKYNPYVTVSLLLLAGSLLWVKPGVLAADKGKTVHPDPAPNAANTASPDGANLEEANTGANYYGDNYEGIDPETRLYVEQRINEKNLSDYEKIIEIKTKALQENANDKFAAVNERLLDSIKFGTIIISIIGLSLTLGLVAYIKYIRSKIDSMIAAEIKKSADEQNAKLQNISQSHQKDIAELKQKFEERIKSNIAHVENLSKEAEQKIKNAVEIASRKKPEELTLDDKERVEEAVEGLKQKPEAQYSADDYFVKGYEASIKGRHEEALAYYDKAIKLKPDYAEAWNNKGIALGKLERYEDAISAYDKAIKLKPDYAEAYYNLACIYALKKDKTMAVKYLDMAVDKGYNKLEHIEQDKSLDFIRHAPEYKEIIQKLRQKTSSGRV